MFLPPGLGLVNIAACPLLPPGVQVLLRDLKVVYIGALGDPIEDAVFNGMLLSPSDFDRLMRRLEEQLQ